MPRRATSPRRPSVLLLTEWHDHRLARGVARRAREESWHLALDPVFRDEVPWGWRGDGCIAMIMREQTVKFVRTLGVPVVDVNYAREDYRCARVHQDDRAIGRAAAAYFSGRMFRNYAWYSEDWEPVARERCTSFAESVASEGHACKGLLWKPGRRSGSSAWRDRRAWLSKRLPLLPVPTALFCVDDRMAASAVEVAVELGIEVPDRLAVLGAGNLEIACESSQIPLSSVAVDVERLGYEAARLLGRLMAGRRPPARPVLVPPSGIIERRSTQTFAASDPGARRAMRFMLNRFADDIRVDDIADSAALSRRRLNYLFKKEFGCGPAHLLERVRLEHAKRLLRNTGAKVHAVALESGFGSALRLHRSFRRVEGTTPAAFRRTS